MENEAGVNNPSRIYTDFEPYCIWHRKEDNETLHVHLHGFKKEQLKVRIDNMRILTIAGERPLDGNNKWSRFCKQIKLADNIKVNDISSNLAGGILSVVIPKKPTTLPMSISLASEVPQMDHTATENAGVWRLELDKNMGIKVGVVLAFLLLGFGVYVKCLCGK
ncbi:18.1 kDa class I heat shock protein-like [Ziziphus jujuba]|uniref:18.1 kDa class I heat shock protein-like n=1 Tax=Ziziphus jujuba TaxID=326968 RepID=A0A6P3ZS61_ZIZJJ|nr:18.1 kDa class I heat shock protein-like [Ziziphus jujuba]